MRIATWNINSLRTRAETVSNYLTHNDIDVLCLQETKCSDKQFPEQIFTDAGYQVTFTGDGSFNGVAIASRIGLEHIGTDFGQPGFSKDASVLSPPLEPRAVGAICGDVEVWSVYIPNGRSISDPHFSYKLEWLSALADYTHTRVDSPDALLTVTGDFNIIPTDQDCWDPSFFEGKTHATPREREALQILNTHGGLNEVSASPTPGEYTYWDYQAQRFQRNQGIRIDLHYDSPALAATVKSVIIDKDERRKKGASDHTPVIVEYVL